MLDSEKYVLQDYSMGQPYKYLKDHSYYSDLYDRLTIEEGSRIGARGERSQDIIEGRRCWLVVLHDSALNR